MCYSVYTHRSSFVRATSTWHVCTNWNQVQCEPKRKPSKQSKQLQFYIKLPTLTIMSPSSQQNRGSHLTHVVIPFCGETLKPGCDFSIKAPWLSGLVCVLELEIERRISDVMTCLCSCKKGFVSLLSMNCVLICIPTELSLFTTQTHTQTAHKSTRYKTNPWFSTANTHAFILASHTQNTHTPLLSIFLPYFLTI